MAFEAAEEYGNYGGFNIGAMVKQTTTPEFEKFEALVDKNDLDSANRQFDKIVQSCNSCHQNTQNGYLIIKRTTANPYMQHTEN